MTTLKSTSCWFGRTNELTGQGRKVAGNGLVEIVPVNLAVVESFLRIIPPKFGSADDGAHAFGIWELDNHVQWISGVMIWGLTSYMLRSEGNSVMFRRFMMSARYIS